MRKRAALALLIIVVDMAIPFIPLTAFFAAFVLIRRPRWFLKFLKSVYYYTEPKEVVEARLAAKRKDIEAKALARLQPHRDDHPKKGKKNYPTTRRSKEV